MFIFYLAIPTEMVYNGSQKARRIDVKKGIAVAGTTVLDILYPIQGFPRPGELTNIVGEMSRSTGGCMCNDIMDLAALDPDLPLTALGRVGNDEPGDFLLSRLRRFPNIDLAQIVRAGTTSFTLVMADEISKQRSFYYCKGASADFCEDDIRWDALDVDLLHIGYILLLDALDAPDADYGTRLARLLHTAKKRGIRTSVDFVTEPGERTRRVAAPALKYADYCVINESEAQALTGVRLVDDAGGPLRENMPAALEAMKAMGVADWAVIHCPRGGFGMDENGRYVEVPGLTLPRSYIKGSVGAGDAFCSGVLYAAWRGQSLREAIELGTAAAACSLSRPGATEGMRSCAEAMALYRELMQNPT